MASFFVFVSNRLDTGSILHICLLVLNVKMFSYSILQYIKNYIPDMTKSLPSDAVNAKNMFVVF
jgi:hypothetical protein